MAEGLAARQAVLALLSGVLGDRMTLAELSEGAILARLPASERARAQRLALNVLRQVEPIDRLLQGFLKREPRLDVLNILRLAVVELAGGAAAHGVVNSAVELARGARQSAAAAGMVNAVLRKVPVGVVLTGAVQKMPRWLRQPAVHAYGRDAVAAIEAVQARVPPLDLTLNGGVHPGGQVLPGHAGLPGGEVLPGDAVHPGGEVLPGDAVHPGGEVLPTGSLRLIEGGQVSALPGFAEGAWWVQDAAAALAVPMLGDVAGLAVLDLCAAPGGKTMQLAAAGARVTALDMSGPRMARLRDNLARTGLMAELVVADALHWQPQTLFDAVLLDAPCSATGTIRRHPDLQYVKDGSELPGLVALQAQLLDRALGFLKPGGRMVYCTCSLLPDEGEAQLNAALARHPGLSVVQRALPGVPTDWFGALGELRLRPDYWAERGGMDGFFMVCLTKQGRTDGNTPSLAGTATA